MGLLPEVKEREKERSMRSQFMRVFQSWPQFKSCRISLDLVGHGDLVSFEGAVDLAALGSQFLGLAGEERGLVLSSPGVPHWGFL